MAFRVDDKSSSGSESPNLLELEDEEGWEDFEPDMENVPIVCLFDEKTFPDVHKMLHHCNETYGFDLLKIKEGFDLDYIGTAKLVNYIRSEVKNGNVSPDLSSKSVFQDQRYLQPALEDDALLYSLDDLDGNFSVQEPTKDLEREVISEGPEVEPEQVIAVLARAQRLETELELLKKQFLEHKMATDEVLENRWAAAEGTSSTNPMAVSSNASNNTVKFNDAGYFESYGSNYIHRMMLQDKVRTQAYRDFIYGHKHLFKDKVVLDVGCGSGILSLFCARAGAKRVIAVDNSEIVYKAMAVVLENELDDIIHVLRGKIEELDIGVKTVDIIVSEWMGYCLLFEGMLESVLWARDQYLKPSGLMVPSHVTLRVAPICDQEHVVDEISFWEDVYGFSMKSMLEDASIYKEVRIRDVRASSLAADSEPIYHANLHHQAIDEHRNIYKDDVNMTLTKGIGSLDGFAVWFDTFFATSADEQIPISALGESWSGKELGGRETAFTTGPKGPYTHWQQGSLLIDRRACGVEPLATGQLIKAKISCEQNRENARELLFKINWQVEGTWERMEQVWYLK